MVKLYWRLRTLSSKIHFLRALKKQLVDDQPRLTEDYRKSYHFEKVVLELRRAQNQLELLDALFIQPELYSLRHIILWLIRDFVVQISLHLVFVAIESFDLGGLSHKLALYLFADVVSHFEVFFYGVLTLHEAVFLFILRILVLGVLFFLIEWTC